MAYSIRLVSKRVGGDRASDVSRLGVFLWIARSGCGQLTRRRCWAHECFLRNPFTDSARCCASIDLSRWTLFPVQPFGTREPLKRTDFSRKILMILSVFFCLQGLSSYSTEHAASAEALNSFRAWGKRVYFTMECAEEQRLSVMLWR